MPVETLTKNLVKDSICPSGKHKIDIHDSGCKGLMLEVRATGGKTYYFRYRDDRSKVRQMRIGAEDTLTLKQARTLCDRYRSKLAMGEDPWEAKAELKRVPKLETFIWESFLPFIKTYKRSWDTDQSLLKNHIVPTFGHLYMDQLNKKHVIDFIGKHLETHAPGSVNRVTILLRYIYNCAIRWETTGITKNPTNNIPLLEENNKKERFLSKEEAEKHPEETK